MYALRAHAARRSTRSLESMVRKAVIAAAILLVLSGACIALYGLIDPLGIDACLNAGGNYNLVLQSCEATKLHPTPQPTSRSPWHILGGSFLIALGVGLFVYWRRSR